MLATLDRQGAGKTREFTRETLTCCDVGGTASFDPHACWKGIRANGAPLAYFQPKFIVEQVLASCKF